MIYFISILKKQTTKDLINYEAALLQRPTQQPQTATYAPRYVHTRSEFTSRASSWTCPGRCPSS